jgi:hypothetical protein
LACCFILNCGRVLVVRSMWRCGLRAFSLQVSVHTCNHDQINLSLSSATLSDEREGCVYA